VANTLSFSSPWVAHANEVDEALIQSTSQGISPTDTLVSVLFTLSAIALVTVTGGVLYLSIKQWQDGTDEKKAQISGSQGKSLFAPERNPGRTESRCALTLGAIIFSRAPVVHACR
jgi:hypothetical protein